MGASWNKYTKLDWDEIEGEKLSKTWVENTIQIGSIYRPFNFLSFGDNLTVSEELDYIHNYRAGLSIRPFLKHHLTIGSDIILKNNGNDKFTETIIPFISIQPLLNFSISNIYISMRNNIKQFCNQ